MRILKTRWFHRWVTREGLTDNVLIDAVIEIGNGLVDANLGGNVFKKRISVRGQGKRAGLRVLLACRQEERVIFLYGFSKSQRANISSIELQALKQLANVLLNYDASELTLALKSGELLEVQNGK